MTNNALLGKLLSEHKLADYRRTGLISCGVFLLLPFLCGLWSFIASLTYGSQASSATEGFYVSLVMLVGSLMLFGLLLLLSYFSPLWAKKYGLEIYENGFIKKNFLNSQTCLWSEISNVNPMLLANRYGGKIQPGEFANLDEDTKYLGIYEVYKRDGSKITVSRRYTDIERLDERLIPFCREIPNW